MSYSMAFLGTVAIGGALGAVSRYLATGWIAGVAGTSFPYGTLIVNVIGSLLIGLVYELVMLRLELAPEWRALVAVGFLGAFTTFSTFSLETLLMLQQGLWDKAVAYVMASVVLCVLASAIGVRLGKLV